MKNKIITPVSAVYEHPFGERVKMLMRLEAIFMQLENCQLVRDEYETQMYLRALFELLNITKRYELRSLLLKELERLRVVLSQLQDNEAVVAENIHNVFNELEDCKRLLHELDSKKIEAVRNIEFLNIVKLRSIHEIGSYFFETPELKYWLLQPAESRQELLKTWLLPLLVYEKTAKFMLNLLRNSAEEEEVIAEKGMYIRSTRIRTGSIQRLLLIEIDKTFDVYPSVSGDAYRYVIRFMQQKQMSARAVQSKLDVKFRLKPCSI